MYLIKTNTFSFNTSQYTIILTENILEYTLLGSLYLKDVQLST